MMWLFTLFAINVGGMRVFLSTSFLVWSRPTTHGAFLTRIVGHHHVSQVLIAMGGSDVYQHDSRHDDL